MALVQLISASPVFAPYVNPYETIKELYKAFEIRNVNKLINTPPQVQMVQMQQQKQQVDMMMMELAKLLAHHGIAGLEASTTKDSEAAAISATG